MRLLIALLLGMILGCGDGPWPEKDQDVLDYVHQRFEQAIPDHGPVMFTHVTWYLDQQCIPSPFDPDDKETCRRGRAWAAGPAACWIEVVWRDYSQSYADTSFAHEALHCWFWREIGDPDHSHPEWGKTPYNADALLPTVNREIRALGW
jgi:hypothetical protein